MRPQGLSIKCLADELDKRFPLTIEETEMRITTDMESL